MNLGSWRLTGLLVVLLATVIGVSLTIPPLARYIRNRQLAAVQFEPHWLPRAMQLQTTDVESDDEVVMREQVYAAEPEALEAGEASVVISVMRYRTGFDPMQGRFEAPNVVRRTVRDGRLAAYQAPARPSGGSGTSLSDTPSSSEADEAIHAHGTHDDESTDGTHSPPASAHPAPDTNGPSERGPSHDGSDIATTASTVSWIEQPGVAVQVVAEGVVESDVFAVVEDLHFH